MFSAIVQFLHRKMLEIGTSGCFVEPPRLASGPNVPAILWQDSAKTGRSSRPASFEAPARLGRSGRSYSQPGGFNLITHQACLRTS